MATGYKLDADSIRLIDKVVRQVMASEPTTRGRQRRSGGGGKPSTFEGVLGITLEDIPPAELVDPPADMPNAPKEYRLSFGEVARVSLAVEDDQVLVTQTGFEVDVEGGDPNHDKPREVDLWCNTCADAVHKGRLVQGKKITIGGTSITVVDVEPCE